MYGTASQLLVRGKIRLLELERPESEGHATSNEDEYQKSIWLNFRHCLRVSSINLMITCNTSGDPDVGSGDTAYRHTVVYHSSTSVYMTNLVEIG